MSKIPRLRRVSGKKDQEANFQVSGVAVHVERASYTLEELRAAQIKAIESEPHNFEQWEQALSSEERRVAMEMVIHALHTLAEDAEWIPYSTEIKDGQVLDVNLRILLTDVDETVRKQEAEYLATVDAIPKLTLGDA